MMFAAWACASFALAGVASAAPAPGHDFQQLVLGYEEHAQSVHGDDQPVEAFMPPLHPPVIDKSDQTIFQILNESLHHEHHHDGFLARLAGTPSTPPLHKFAKFMNFTQNEELFQLLDDPQGSYSLLAPDDKSLDKLPHHRHGDHHDHHDDHQYAHEAEGIDGSAPDDDVQDVFGGDAPVEISDLINAIADDQDAIHDMESSDNERRQKFRKLIAYIIRYHTLHGAYIGRELADKSTVATELSDLRVRVQPTLSPYGLRFNFLFETRGPVIKAKNGYIYLLNDPLLLPLPPMQTLFVFPQLFSTLTSGLQKVHVNVSTFGHHQHHPAAVDALVTELFDELVDELPKSTSYTVFAPINFAFARLGFKANAFLFSPFGRRVLKDVLSYHVVKDVVLFSDHIQNHTCVDSASSGEIKEDVKMKIYDLTTQFNQTSLPVRVYEYHKGPFGRGPLRRDIWAGERDHDPVPVIIPDGPAFKAAYHVISKLLVPPQFKHHEQLSHLFEDHQEDRGPLSMLSAEAIEPEMFKEESDFLGFKDVLDANAVQASPLVSSKPAQRPRTRN